MEIQTENEHDSENEDLLIRLNVLFDAGLYRQVLIEGEAALGPLEYGKV